jgi:excisionase family DNA binding protein
MKSAHRRTSESAPTQALFVRIPAEHARRLDRAAFELGRPKQALVSELVERYIDPDSPASLAAFGSAVSAPGPASAAPLGLRAEAGRRRVTIETLEPDTMVVGHHSFRPAEPRRPAAPAPEVLRSEETAELLRVSPEVVEELAAAGELPGRMLAGEWRFSRAALLAWLARAPAEDADGDENGGR